MNTANKITMSRIFLTVIMLIVLLFPWTMVGVDMPVWKISRINETIELRYIIAGLLFVLASITDFIDGYVARKYNMVTDFGKMVDAISDKLLTSAVLIILACDGVVSPIIAVVIISRDIFVDTIKMVLGNKGHVVAAIKVAKYKTASLMFGLALSLFGNLPFELFNIRISDFLLVLAAILSVVSGVKYYMMSKEYITEK